MFQDSQPKRCSQGSYVFQVCFSFPRISRPRGIPAEFPNFPGFPKFLPGFPALGVFRPNAWSFQVYRSVSQDSQAKRYSQGTYTISRFSMMFPRIPRRRGAPRVPSVSRFSLVFPTISRLKQTPRVPRFAMFSLVFPRIPKPRSTTRVPTQFPGFPWCLPGSPGQEVLPGYLGFPRFPWCPPRFPGLRRLQDVQT